MGFVLYNHFWVMCTVTVVVRCKVRCAFIDSRALNNVSGFRLIPVAGLLLGRNRKTRY